MKRKFRFPIWLKALLVLLFSVSIVSVVAIVFSSNTFRNITRNHYIEHSVELANTLGVYLNLDDVKAVKNKTDQIYQSIPDADKVENSYWGEIEWENYLANYVEVVEMPEYQRLFAQLEAFHSKNDVKYTYIAYADFEHSRLVYLVDDSPEDEKCLPGSFDDFTEHDMQIYDNPSAGFTPEITNMPEYGYLVSTGQPIYDGNTLVAFALVDLSMDEIIAKENAEIKNMIVILASIGAGAVIIGFGLVLLLINRPMSKLTKAANEYISDANSELDKFSKIKINTRDEIEDLSNSMKKMEADINRYIGDLLYTHTKLEGAEKQVDEFRSLADKDALTGVGNKRAYFEAEERLNALIRTGEAKFAISMIDLNDLKVVNDSEGHERGDDLIVTLSRIVKKVYPSSSIFRIGGDEFVVITEGDNIKNVKKQERDFNFIIDTSIHNNKNKKHIVVSAAIGTAVFDKDIDNNVEDTFKRADRKMYENKRIMKGMY